jgi:hypothetical protein
MIDWLWNNKQWIFSGIGVTVIIAAVALGRWLVKQYPRPLIRSRRRDVGMHPLIPPEYLPSTAPTQPPETDRMRAQRALRVMPITFAEIFAAIDAAPPLERDAVAARYRGIAVQWSTWLRSARGTGRDDEVAVRLVTSESIRTVACTVRLSEYPELRVVLQETRIQITGRIAGVDLLNIELEDADLVINPPVSSDVLPYLATRRREQKNSGEAEE